MAALTVSGTVRVPGDKSISHRSLMLAALARGRSTISGILQSADVESTAHVLRALGAPIPELGAAMSVTGVGLAGLTSPGDDLFCGNSGTTARLIAGMVAGSESVAARFTGDESLTSRPMRRVTDPLVAMGADVAFDSGDHLPMTVRGARLRATELETGLASAQVKSAILLAALVSRTDVTVTEKAPSRDHTERMLAAVGVELDVRGSTTRLHPVDELLPLHAEVPGDPSSAAFFVALATLSDEGAIALPGVCMNPTRGGFLAILLRAGAAIGIDNPTTESGEEVATLLVEPARLSDIAISAADVPSMIDELPLLACVAAAAGINLEMRGADELRRKESDRIGVIVQNLRALGADATELPDGLLVGAGKRPLAGRVVTRGDHRIAMAFGILARLPGNDITIDDPGCVAVSYPGFWSDLDSVTA